MRNIFFYCKARTSGLHYFPIYSRYAFVQTGLNSTFCYHMMRKARKRPLCNMQTAQVNISLRVSAGWAGPSLSAYSISGYYSVCRRKENVQVRLHRYARWSGPTLSVNCIRVIFVRCASHENTASVSAHSDKWGAMLQNVPADMCAQITFKSVCAFAQCNQSRPHFGHQRMQCFFTWTRRRLCTDCEDMQSDFSIRWTHMSESTFSHLLQLRKSLNELEWLPFQCVSAVLGGKHNNPWSF